MVLQRNYLAEALAALDDAKRPIRQSLDAASMLFWQAYVFQGAHWSAQVQSKADAILTKLLTKGQMRRTVAEMDDPALASASDELRRFIEACERE